MRKHDERGRRIGSNNCTASGQQRTWDRDAWGAEFVICPDCGYCGDILWVRNTDLAPHAKTRAHKAPEGVTPGPYAYSPTGGLVYGKRYA